MIEVTALLYSGRPDPKWELGPQQESDFWKHFNKLQFGISLPYSLQPSPPYGFRGFTIKTNDKTYTLYQEKIELEGGEDGLPWMGYDNDRLIEAVLINSAPIHIRPHLTSF